MGNGEQAKLKSRFWSMAVGAMVVTVLASCGQGSITTADAPGEDGAVTTQVDSAEGEGSKSDPTVSSVAQDTISPSSTSSVSVAPTAGAESNRDWAIRGDRDSQLDDLVAQTIASLSNPPALATLVGPQGLLVSPDGFIDSDDVVLTAEDLSIPSEEALRWGYRDGSGEEIVMTAGEMFGQLVNSQAITDTEIVGYDTVVGAGNTINNVSDWFSDAVVVEYHFSGTEDYAGLDWSSIRFVCSKPIQGESPVLLAIVSDHWTI